MYRIYLVSNRTIIQNYRNLNITRRLSIKTFNNYYYRILKSKQILVRKRNLISKRFFQRNLNFKEIFININSNDTVSRSIFFFFCHSSWDLLKCHGPEDGSWSVKVSRDTVFISLNRPLSKKETEERFCYRAFILWHAIFSFFFSTFEQDEFSRNFLVTRLSERWSVT